MYIYVNVICGILSFLQQEVLASSFLVDKVDAHFFFFFFSSFLAFSWAELVSLTRSSCHHQHQGIKNKRPRQCQTPQQGDGLLWNDRDNSHPQQRCQQRISLRSPNTRRRGKKRAATFAGQGKHTHCSKVKGLARTKLANSFVCLFF